MIDVYKSGSLGEGDLQRLKSVIADCRQRRGNGEAVSDESLIAAHPELMPALAQELRKLRIIDAARQQAALPEAVETKTFQHDPSATQRGRLEVRCPNCHVSIDIDIDTRLNEL